ncbi:hypothetical protein PanWU01x14_132550 [Parasponia andersonii]|uniref:Uncharacterized protein n=1 Tax=Parasponia andersonii TaxID=3476 RepID=A0A2P5CQP1_PARAD|nr:hypothetical protein PanWU01x14_132550 [Parasponia andersonii]
MAPKRIRIVDIKILVAARRSNVYTGSTFVVSSMSSLLPLSSFSKKKSVSVVVDDSAAKGLGKIGRKRRIEKNNYGQNLFSDLLSSIPV